MFIKIDDLRVFYEVGGEGEAVVLLHGWGGQAASFKPVFNYLVRSHQVYALDLPGFGSSDLPPQPWGSDDYALFVSTFFAKLGIGKTSLIGHSFGGRIAIVLAANFPERVDKLILVDSAGIRPRRTVKYYIRVSIAKIAKFLFSPRLFGIYGEKARKAIYQVVGSKDYQEANEMRPTLVKIVNEDLRGLLPQINAPTLLVWGEKDTATPVSHAKIMEREINDAGLVILPEAGHFSYLDKFPQFCRIVSSFLGD
ncbi:MAG: alpha/beta hydrolase [bacterium]